MINFLTKSVFLTPGPDVRNAGSYKVRVLDKEQVEALRSFVGKLNPYWQFLHGLQDFIKTPDNYFIIWGGTSKTSKYFRVDCFFPARSSQDSLKALTKLLDDLSRSDPGLYVSCGDINLMDKIKDNRIPISFSNSSNPGNLNQVWAIFGAWLKGKILPVDYYEHPEKYKDEENFEEGVEADGMGILDEKEYENYLRNGVYKSTLKNNFQKIKTFIAGQNNKGFFQKIKDLLSKRESYVSTSQNHPLIEGLRKRNYLLENSVSPDDFTVDNGKITGYTGSASDIVIPDSINGTAITSIGAEAFKGNGKIKSIVLPDSIKTLEPRTFENCSNLASIKMKVKDVGDDVFKGCNNLQKVLWEQID